MEVEVEGAEAEAEAEQEGEGVGVRPFEFYRLFGRGRRTDMHISLGAGRTPLFGEEPT